MKVIMSVDEKGMSQIDLKHRRGDFEHALDIMGVRYEVCEGQYDGTREQSYMINYASVDTYNTLKRIAKQCNQVSILRVTSYGGTLEMFIDHNCGTQKQEAYLGKWSEVPSKPDNGNYTQSFLTGKVYAAI